MFQEEWPNKHRIELEGKHQWMEVFQQWSPWRRLVQQERQQGLRQQLP